MQDYNAAVSGWSEPIDRAYAACQAAAPTVDCGAVWPRLLPAAMRPHVAAVCAYAAIARGIAAQRTRPVEERLTLIDAWQRRLHAAIAVELSGGAPHAHEDLIVVALAHSIRSLDLPLAWVDDLVSACGQDITTTRYDSWSALFEQCNRSASPIGRLVLRIAGYRDEALDRSSDALCTAIQLTRWWQDFSPDWVIGCLRVPRDVSAACRAREMELEGPLLNDAWAAAMRQCVARTREQFDAGRFVCDAVSGRLRYERRLTWLRGSTLLDQVERAGPAIRSYSPRLGLAAVPRVVWGAARWRATA